MVIKRRGSSQHGKRNEKGSETGTLKECSQGAAPNQGKLKQGEYLNMGREKFKSEVKRREGCAGHNTQLRDAVQGEMLLPAPAERSLAPQALSDWFPTRKDGNAVTSSKHWEQRW